MKNPRALRGSVTGADVMLGGVNIRLLLNAAPIHQAYSQNVAALDRIADALLQQGHYHQAERLSHRAAELRLEATP